MAGVVAIVPAAGRGTRMTPTGEGVAKQLLHLGGRPLIMRTLDALWDSHVIDDIVIAGPHEGIERLQRLVSLLPYADHVRVVQGGKERQDSVWAALQAAPADAELVVVHDAVRPLVTPALVQRVIEAARVHGGAIAAVPVADTLKRARIASGTEHPEVQSTVDRTALWAAQTPQAFDAKAFRAAYEEVNRRGIRVTDDAGVFEAVGGNVALVEGDPRNIKITRREDFVLAEQLIGESRPAMRVGIGYDVHRLTAGRPLILGGVRIPHELGLLGHSDADVLTHAVMDGLLGACALGDIGTHFPDTDPAFKDADSIELLRRVVRLVEEAGYRPVHVDAVVAAQRPKLAPYIPAMREALANAMGISVDGVSVKATTTEGLGFVGREEGIEARTVVTLRALPAFA